MSQSYQLTYRRRLCRLSPRVQRRGAVAIEGALLTMVMVIIILGATDIGQYINVAQTINNASREGARIAAKNSTQTVAEIRTAILDYLADQFPEKSSAELDAAVVTSIRDETTGTFITDNLSTISSGAPLSVTVNFDFNSVRWLPGIDYWNLNHHQTGTVVRRE